MLIYGIPEFRLPKEIVRHEVNVLRQMGVDFQTNVVIGKTVTIDELMTEEGYDAVLIATGAGLPKFLDVPGEHLNGVYSANEFLTRVNLMRAYDPAYDEPVFDCRGKDIAVVGGGNTAMDAVRTACRLGARTSYLIYRRSEKEMPARVEEAQHAKDEGIQFLCLTNPVAFLGDDQGRLQAVRCIRMELGEPDASGRRSPVAGAGLGVRAADRDGRHRAGHRRQPAGPIDDARPEDQPQGLHRGRPGDAADLEARRVRGGRHRHRRGHRDPGHGRRPQGGPLDRRVPARGPGIAPEMSQARGVPPCLRRCGRGPSVPSNARVRSAIPRRPGVSRSGLCQQGGLEGPIGQEPALEPRGRQRDSEQPQHLLDGEPPHLGHALPLDVTGEQRRRRLADGAAVTIEPDSLDPIAGAELQLQPDVVAAERVVQFGVEVGGLEPPAVGRGVVMVEDFFAVQEVVHRPCSSGGVPAG